MKNSPNDRGWIAPPKIIIRKGKKGGPQKLSYWIDKQGKNHLYTKKELEICNILTNLNLILIRSLILLDMLKTIDKNAKVKKLVGQDHAKYKATKSSVFNRFVSLMAAAPDITFGEFLSFISDSRDEEAISKIGKKPKFDVFYTSDFTK